MRLTDSHPKHATEKAHQHEKAGCCSTDALSTHSACGCDDHDHVEKGGCHDHDHHGHEHEHEHEKIDDTFVEEKNSIVWHVEGMDCTSCAATIAKALQRMPGTDNVHVSLTRERLALKLDDTKTTREEIEKTVSSLGYKLEKLEGDRKQETADKSWWQTSKGKAALSSGLLLVIAYAVSLAIPSLSFWIFTLAALAALVPVAMRAFSALRNGSPFTIEMLMTIAAIGAIFINATEEAAVVVFLFCVGEVLEGVAAGRARAGIKALGQLAPKTAWRETNGKLEEISAESLAIGDVIVVRPGDRIAADGEIIDGMSGVDESPVTGESVPVVKGIGEKVYAGSINSEATLRIEVETKASDNTIARIIALVEEAQDAKAPTERFIDAFAKVYMPIIVGIAILIAVIPPLFDGFWTQWTYRALTLLLIGCPCALVISVPAAIASGLSAGTRLGLLVKGGNVIETLAKLDRITFDKTGTLTQGKPVVTDIVGIGKTDDALLSLAYALERESSHPLALAIVKEAESRHLLPVDAKNVRAIAGKGIIASAENQTVFIGAPRSAAEFGTLHQDYSKQADKLEAQGKTVIAILSNGEAAGLIALRDEPRDDALEAIAQLKQLGIESIMLTGDNKRTGEAIAATLGMSAKTELMPEMKATAIADLRKGHLVAMVGDGINDAPALAAADVGIAMGSGTDVALETADAAILRNRIGDIATLIRLARKTMGNIRQNVAIALGLKAIFLITTILGITGLWLAIMADTGATVLVTLNALRLLTFKK
ncbi:heavy metal translocating P-type ATPase [Bartonella sp. LJL80]